MDTSARVYVSEDRLHASGYHEAWRAAHPLQRHGNSIRGMATAKGRAYFAWNDITYAYVEECADPVIVSIDWYTGDLTETIHAHVRGQLIRPAATDGRLRPKGSR